MSKFRILKLNDERYLLQKKRFFSGWNTVDYFSDFLDAKIYFIRRNPRYNPEEGEIVWSFEC